MKNNPSRDQLTKSLDRRIKHLMIQVLQKFEDTFPGLEENVDSRIFKGDLKNAFNDVIRAQRDELRDYEIDYRPLQIRNDSMLSMTQTFIQTVQRVEFGFYDEPYIKIYSSLENRRVLESLRNELNAGILIHENDSLVLEVVGTQSCVDSVISFMDRYCLHANVGPRYNEWRGQVVKSYRRQV